MGKNVLSQFHSFIHEYTSMHVGRIVTHCPYWMNKIKYGKVVCRGVYNGKGKALEIKTELDRHLEEIKKETIKEEDIVKLAKRHRIGIDCSGFVYRVLEELIRLRYHQHKIESLLEVFPQGVERTNADQLTKGAHCFPILRVRDIQIGDMIRLAGGKHVAIVIEKTKENILYAHSSSRLTRIQGVHEAMIRIVDANVSLDKQQWLEIGKKGENFGLKYYNILKKDNIFRLRIFS